ncbi:MAG: hypothetical protein JNM94_04700 [Phycisphaerae bacterium]|nr:hypothetical protein [Phycisphaerae bacterium]
MKRTRRFRLPQGPRGTLLLVGTAVGVGIASLAGFAVGAKWFTEERATTRKTLLSAENAIKQINGLQPTREKLERDLKSVVNRTFGPDQAATDSALRSRLNRIGEEIRLSDLRVATGTPTMRTSPAKRLLPKVKDQRYYDDFVEVPATITGSGTLEQALRLVHRIEVEPWLKRIDSVGLEEEKDGERIKVTVKLTTIFLPDQKGTADLRPSDADLERFERLRPIVLANPFRVPTPPKPQPTAVAADPAPPPPPAPAGFPYDQWLVTSLVSGPLGPEAWLRNATTGETRVVTPGQAIGEAIFVDFDVDIAQFRQGDASFRVQIGRPLTDRQS